MRPAAAHPTIGPPPLIQRAIQAFCRHPGGAFVEFPAAEVEQSIVQRFERQVLAAPDRLAVKDGDLVLTYRGLNARANRIARTLHALSGPQPEPVALCFEPGAAGVAAMLGVLKAGKFFVPLDPASPLDRSAHILDRSGAGLVLTHCPAVARAREFAGSVTVLEVEDAGSRAGDGNLGLPMAPDAIGYVLFTSGSTGRPKGVIHSHRNVLYVVRNHTNALRLGPDDRLSLLYPLISTGAMKDVFAAILNGAALYPFVARRDGLPTLARWLDREGITIYHSVSTLFRSLVGGSPAGPGFPTVRVISFGGERVARSDVDLYRRHFPDPCILHAVLGSTEASSTCQVFLAHDTPLPGGEVPAGYPVEGTDVLLRDEADAPVADDQVGRICFRSRHLAIGYWRQPAETAAAFRPDPSGPGVRLYRSGDLGRRGADGCLVHVGRLDARVKIRGFGVDVAEVELALRAHPAVAAAAVLLRQDRPDTEQLVAYVVPTHRVTLDLADLFAVLRRTVLGPMIPARLVPLAALPLTPTGKLDVLALPVPARTRPDLPTPFAAPRTPVEETLARLCRETLDLEAVGIDDDFLHLGGDSLLAARLVARLRAPLGVEVPPGLVLELGTISRLAVAVTQRQVERLGRESLAHALDAIQGGDAMSPHRNP